MGAAVADGHVAGPGVDARTRAAPPAPARAGRAGGDDGASIAVQTIGAFWYTGRERPRFSTRAPTTGCRAPGSSTTHPSSPSCAHPRPRAATSPAPFAAISTSSARRRGGDRRRGRAVIAPGTSLRGWALACGRTPAERDAARRRAGHRKTRKVCACSPDIAAAMGSDGAFDVERRSGHARPRPRRARAAGRRPRRGEERHPHREREQVLVEPPLSELARRAARAAARAPERSGLLADDAHRRAALRGNPGQEMNTFLTAMLVDLATPVAKEHGLEDGAGEGSSPPRGPDRSRRAGAVPRPPRRPRRSARLGCAITPDADDTALAWRIAPPPPETPGAPRCCACWRAYRDARGFYRTWLAPQERYQCIDPGRDPNPADVTIQMHVLHDARRERTDAAARSLCQALANKVCRREPLGLLRAGSHSCRCCELPTCERVGCGVTRSRDRGSRGRRARSAGIDGRAPLVEAQLVVVALAPDDAAGQPHAARRARRATTSRSCVATRRCSTTTT